MKKSMARADALGRKPSAVCGLGEPEVRTTVIPRRSSWDPCRAVLNTEGRTPCPATGRVTTLPYTLSQIKELAEIVRPYQPNVMT